MSDELRIEILGETSFARGAGTPGEVDLEIEHDEFGLPEVPGRTIRGLLRDAWLSMAGAFPSDAPFAEALFGLEGDLVQAPARLNLTSARLPEDVRAWVEYACRRSQHPVSPADVLRAFTVVRHRTSRSRESGGGPASGSLRGNRALVPGLAFSANVELLHGELGHWRVLARACLGVREAGTGRTRGGGAVRLSLRGDHVPVMQALAEV